MILTVNFLQYKRQEIETGIHSRKKIEFHQEDIIHLLLEHNQQEKFVV
jgi:hypothetical protein